MTLGFTSPVFGSASLYFSKGVELTRTVRRATAAASGGAFLPLLSHVAGLRIYLEEFQARLEALSQSTSATGNGYRAVSISSSQSLGLDLDQTPATLESTEEINTIATSYSPFGPAFTGASTALPEISGVYDGTNGDMALTFKVKWEGNVGGPYTGHGGAPADLWIEVRDPLGNKLQDVRFTEATPPGTPLDLVNGLKLSFSAGSLARNDEFTIDVSNTVPSSVDPAKPLDGARNDRPNLEPGLAVSAGSFQVNGTNIAVNAGDSINTILSRITSSAAGVIAFFDAGAERIVLTQKTAGSSGQIVLANDTSGFLAATKLAGAVAVPGTDSDLNKPIDQVAALAGIQTGTFSINGVSLTIDTASDSLSDVLAAITSSAARVNASFSGQTVLLHSRNSSATVELSDGSSGFFSAIQIATGSYAPETVTRTVAADSARPFAGAVQAGLDEINERLSALSRTQFPGLAPSEIGSTRDVMQESIKATLGELLGFVDGQIENHDTLDSGLGLHFVMNDLSPYLFQADEGELRTAFERDGEALTEFLLAGSANADGPGLLDRFISAVRGIEEKLTAKAGATGSLLDAFG